MKNNNPTSARRGTTLRWMVVDDNEGLLEFLAAALETIGIAKVSRFNSSTEALQTFAALPEQFQFVVTDFEMPGLNGVALCRRMLALSPQTKILLVTGSANVTAAEASQWGFCGMLAKPFSLTVLRQAIENAAALTPGKKPFEKHGAASLAA